MTHALLFDFVMCHFFVVGSVNRNVSFLISNWLKPINLSYKILLIAAMWQLLNIISPLRYLADAIHCNWFITVFTVILFPRYRLIINNQTFEFMKENDPTILRAPSAGKLIRFTVDDGAHLVTGKLHFFAVSLISTSDPPYLISLLVLRS